MNMFNSFDDCFSAETIADTLSVSKRNIESWAKNGKLVPLLDPKLHAILGNRGQHGCRDTTPPEVVHPGIDSQ